MSAFELDEDLERLIRALPKVELHVHLEGSVGPALALRLARRRGVALPGADAGVEGVREAYAAITGFREFLQMYLAISSTLAQAEDVLIAIDGVAEAMAADNIRRAEVTFTPMTHVNRGFDPDALLDALGEGRRRARERHGVDLAWIFDIVRSFPDTAGPTLELALKGRDAGVFALGVAGPEGPQYAGEPMAPTLAAAKSEGLRSVPHAGELDGPRSIREALSLFHADRIGHGIRCLDDPELVRELVERQIPLEVCPSSNAGLNLVPSLAEHPLPALIDAGLCVTLNSDDPPMFSTTLGEEYRRCVHHFGWGRERILAIAKAGIDRSFAPEADKDVWRSELAALA